MARQVHWAKKVAPHLHRYLLRRGLLADLEHMPVLGLGLVDHCYVYDIYVSNWLHDMASLDS